MSVRPPGGPAPEGFTPATRVTWDALVDAVRGGKPVAIGKTWRLRAAPWPTVNDDECLLLESFQQTDWVTVAVLKPDGTWGYET